MLMLINREIILTSISRWCNNR